MTIAKVQTASHTNTGSTTCAVTITATTGNFLLVETSFAGATTITVADGVNTWTALAGSGSNAGWYSENITGGALTITATEVGAATLTGAIQVLELSGVNVTAPIDRQTFGSQSGTTVTAGPTSAAASAADYVVALVGWGSLNASPYTISGRTFNPALASVTHESEVDSATLSSESSSVAISHGPIAGATAETFTGTFSNSAASLDSAWCILLTSAILPPVVPPSTYSFHATVGPNPATGLVAGQTCNLYRATRIPGGLPNTNDAPPGGGVDYGPLSTDTVVDFYLGGLETIVNTFEAFYLAYYDPADTSNSGSFNTYWLYAPMVDPTPTPVATPLPIATTCLTITGTVAVAASTLRTYIPRACTINSVRASVGTAPTGAALIVDVQKNGTTIWPTNTSNRPTIAISAFTATGTPDTTALALNDYLTVSVTQIGSTIAGSNLTVQVYTS